MTLDELKSLEHGDRVVFNCDNVKGTVSRNPEYASMLEINWDDGEGCQLNTDVHNVEEWALDLRKIPFRGDSDDRGTESDTR